MSRQRQPATGDLSVVGNRSASEVGTGLPVRYSAETPVTSPNHRA